MACGHIDCGAPKPPKSNVVSSGYSCMKNSASNQGLTISRELLSASSVAASLKICSVGL